MIEQTIHRTSSISFPFLGDWSINPPSCFYVFGKCIYFYGVIIAAAFLIGTLYCAKNSEKFGFKEDDVYDALLWLIPLSIVGARLYYVLFRLDYYSAHPDEIIAIWNGGLAIYGGIIAGVIVLLLVCRKKKIPPLAMIDLFIIACCLGQAMGRWGNFFNREAFGAETEFFCRMGLTSPSGSTVYVHPTFLYESIWNVILFICLNTIVQRGKRKYNGELLFIYCAWYGLGRLWIEGLRTDSLYLGPVRISQLLSLILLIFGGTMLFIRHKKMKAEQQQC